MTSDDYVFLAQRVVFELSKMGYTLEVRMVSGKPRIQHKEMFIIFDHTIKHEMGAKAIAEDFVRWAGLS